jgi:CHASE2 domain-containing sensor protein
MNEISGKCRELRNQRVLAGLPARLHQLGVAENSEKWPRSLHARLVNIVSAQGTVIVTFDVHSLEPRLAQDDKLFARTIS